MAKKIKTGKGATDEINEDFLAMYRKVMHEHLERMRAKYERGEKGALMEAVNYCATSRIALPQWAARSFEEAYKAVTEYQARTWDEVFGAPHAKRTRLAAARKKYRLRHAVWHRVREMGKGINASTFEAAGEEYNIGKTLAEEYYYDVEKNGDPLLKLILSKRLKKKPR